MFNWLFNKPKERKGYVRITHDVVTLPSGARVLRLRCSGYYPSGCRGAPQAFKICETGVQALRNSNAAGVLLDISDLEYVWGDDLLRTFDIPCDDSVSHKRCPIAVIIGPKCEKAVKSLLEDGLDDWREANLLFFDEASAFEQISREMRNQD